MEAWQIIQGCRESDGYNKEKFLLIMGGLPIDEFDIFCREILHLRHFYDTNKSAWVTDHSPLLRQYPHLFWQLKPIDFESPVAFIRIT